MVAVAKRMKPWSEKIDSARLFDRRGAGPRQAVRQREVRRERRRRCEPRIDASKSDQQVRGSTVLRTARARSFASRCSRRQERRRGREAGADVLPRGPGREGQAASSISTWSWRAGRNARRGQLGQISARGLMRTPRSARSRRTWRLRSVTPRPARFASRGTSGRAALLARQGQLHAEALKDNLRALLADLQKAKPRRPRRVPAADFRVLDDGPGSGLIKRASALSARPDDDFDAGRSVVRHASVACGEAVIIEDRRRSRSLNGRCAMVVPSQCLTALRSAL